jgi:hypothetical protein
VWFIAVVMPPFLIGSVGCALVVHAHRIGTLPQARLVRRVR